LLYAALGLARGHGKWLARVEKYQFFKPTLCHEKGKMPLCVNLDAPIVYGFDFERYTDLCQPIEWNGKYTAIMHGVDTGVPAGRRPDDTKVFNTGIHVYNYDYTFKTEERAKELLYNFDRAHERFWGQGYTGKKGDEITPNTAMQDFIDLSLGRYSRMMKPKAIKDHPKHFIPSLEALTYAQWGHSLWDKTVQG